MSVNVNAKATFRTETDSLQDVAPKRLERDVIDRASFVESWLHDHLQGVALAVIAAAFGGRVFVAS